MTTFALTYQTLTIGHLSHDGTKWTFRYTRQFCEQDEVVPLVNFPNVHVTYNSGRLWPFFTHRIPGHGQPMVVDVAHREGIDLDDELAMLSRFGLRCITNPFILVELNDISSQLHLI